MEFVVGLLLAAMLLAFVFDVVLPAVFRGIGWFVITVGPYLLCTAGFVALYRTIGRVLRERYCLTIRSARVLFLGGGVASFLLTVLTVSGTGAPASLALFLAPCFFLGVAMAVVVLWGRHATSPTRKEIDALVAHIDAHRRRVRELCERSDSLQREINRVDVKHGDRLRRREALRQEVKDFIAQDPRGLALAVKQWEDQFREMEEAELRGATRRPVGLEPLAALRSRLLDIELLQRQVGPALARREQLDEECRRLQETLTKERHALDALCSRREELEVQHRRVAQGRLVL